MMAAPTPFARQAAAVGALLDGPHAVVGSPAADEAPGLPAPLGIQVIPLAAIVLTRLNPRRDPGDVGELQASLGPETAPWLVQFPAVMECGDGTYELIFGHRRYQAAQAAGWQQIRCVVWPPLTASQLQRMRLLENFHHRPLDALEQAAALQVLYYWENAVALGREAAATALLLAPDAPALADQVAPLHQLLAEAGWQPTHPPVTWQIVLDRHGIAMSPAARKRLLAVLNVDPALRPVVQAQGLSPSSIRALGRLPPDAQHQVVAAVQETPRVAGKIKRIARVVGRKGYSVEEALDEARGPHGPGDGPLREEAEGQGGGPPGGMSEGAQADVTDLLGMGNRLAAALARLQLEAGGQPPTTLAAPWGD
jgi:ParB/RepB/Spo0J family partition protein